MGLLCGLLGACVAPAFPEGAALEVEMLGTQATLRWPAAEHAEAYWVSANGRRLDELGADVRSYVAGELPEGESLLLAVSAMGEDGEAQLYERVSIPDITAPAFPLDAELGIRVDGDQVILSWPRATDAVSRPEYRVELDGEEVGRRSGLQLPGMRVPLAGRSGARASVFAFDDAGNESPPLEADVPSADP